MSSHRNEDASQRAAHIFELRTAEGAAANGRPSTSENEPKDSGVLNALLRAMAADLERGSLRACEHYQAQWPDHRNLIAAEYAHCGGSAADPSEGEAIGDIAEDASVRFGRYELLRLIGLGGQGAVYLARNDGGQVIALKLLSGLGVKSPGQTARFRREAELASRLHHPGICSILEFGECDGVPFIAMEYVQGEPLSSLIARRMGAPEVGAPADQVNATLAMAREIALALHHAHEAGVVHRDIKPQNVIIRPDGHPVVVDFGIARERDAIGPTLTMTGEILGTPAYMSPEQIDPRPSGVDRRTDVFSLGVLLYETLTGERPFQAPSQEGILEAIRTAEPDDVRAKNPAISRDLALVLGTALEKDLGRRYASALDLAEDLVRVQRHERVAARPLDRWTRCRRWARRNPRSAQVAAATLVVLLLAFAGIWYLKSEAELALRESRRLADAASLIELRKSAADLWPPIPALVPRYEAWLAKASALAERLPIHEAELVNLRRLAECVPSVGEPGSLDEAAIADAQQTADFLSHRRHASTDELATCGAERKPIVLKALSDIEIVLNNAATKRSRLIWRLPTIELQARHDVLAALVDDLREFVQPDRHIGLLADVRDRHEFAHTVEEISLRRFEAAWQDAITQIADPSRCPLYAGLRIKPQLGLVPLGCNPESGLHEFMDLYTADRTRPLVLPSRAATGRIEPSSEQGIVLVLIPGGSSFIGAFDSNGKPPFAVPVPMDDLGHTTGLFGPVELSPYFIAKYELLQSQWQRLTGEHPSQHRSGSVAISDRLPVDSVTWYECNQWLRRAGLTLPTLAQWERAARGGTLTPWHSGSERGALKEVANIAGLEFANFGEASLKVEAWNDGWQQPAAVGTFRPNKFGLYDVHGNLCEWVLDSRATSEWVPRPGDGQNVQVLVPDGLGIDRRLQRGGSYRRDALMAKITYPLSKAAGTRDYESGLRAARGLEP